MLANTASADPTLLEADISGAGPTGDAELTALLQETQTRMFRDPQQAAQTAVEAARLADRLQDLPRLSVALRMQGKAELFSGDAISALIHLEQAQSLAREVNDPQLLSVANRVLGVFYELNEDYERAISYYLEAKRQLDDNSPLRDHGLVQNNIGNVLNRQERFQEALPYLDRAAALFQAAGNAELHQNAQLGQAVAFVGLGQYEQARALLEPLYTEPDTHALTLHQALVIRADLAAAEGDLRQAEALYLRVINTEHDLTMLQSLGQAYAGLGRLREEAGELDAAYQLYRTGLEQIRNKTWLAVEMSLYRRLGALELGRGNYQSAAQIQAEHLERREQTRRFTQHSAVSRLQAELAMERELLRLRQMEFETVRYQREQIIYILGLVIAACTCVLLLLLARLRHMRLKRVSAANRQLEIASETDALTGVGNRRYLQRCVAELRAAAQGTDQRAAVLMIDLDHFKQVNDHHGHDVGDRVLQRVAQTIQQLCRNEEIISRLGGEEFALVLPNIEPGNVLALAERIRTGIANMPSPEVDHHLRPTVSIGIAIGPSASLDFSDLYRRTDEALYRAKETGRNRVVLCPHNEGEVSLALSV